MWVMSQKILWDGGFIGKAVINEIEGNVWKCFVALFLLYINLFGSLVASYEVWQVCLLSCSGRLAICHTNLMPL
jgi:hypothetical protein